MRCQKCGQSVSDGAAFCNNCGSRIETPMNMQQQPRKRVCANCGAEMEPGSVFCGVCGSDGKKAVKKEPEIISRREIHHEEEKKSKTPVIIVTLVLIIVLLAGGIGGYWWYITENDMSFFGMGTTEESQDNPKNEDEEDSDKKKKSDEEDEDSDKKKKSDEEDEEDSDKKKKSDEEDEDKDKKSTPEPTDEPESTPEPTQTPRPTERPYGIGKAIPDATAAPVATDSKGYATYTNGSVGYSCKYPSWFKVQSNTDAMFMCTSSDGLGQMNVSAIANPGDSVSTSMREYAGSMGGSIDYSSSGDDYYAVRIKNGSTFYYKYAKFANGNIYSFSFTFPASQFDSYDAMINDIYASFAEQF